MHRMLPLLRLLISPLLFPGTSVKYVPITFMADWISKQEVLSVSRVHALAEGYISRIRVTHGSGYVLDVAYNNGYKTINRHLSAFVGDVARRVEDLQYEKESWEVEITPEPGEYPVKAGQVIALSGNTGYSFGPHLHLDMFEADTDDYIDPLPFFKKKVKDNTAPRAEVLCSFHSRAGEWWEETRSIRPFLLIPNSRLPPGD